MKAESDSLQQGRKKIEFAARDFLGDYIDRGPDSRSTIDLLIERSRHRNTIFLRGNHEAFLTEVFQDPSRIAD
jgi:serine/threonine protein phosphatase 1